eukprot:9126358-Alexandrium_andersonii.AAC.1
MASQPPWVSCDALQQHSLAANPGSGRPRLKYFALAASARRVLVTSGPQVAAASPSSGPRLGPGK